jgi:hypothetical protein
MGVATILTERREALLQIAGYAGFRRLTRRSTWGWRLGAISVGSVSTLSRLLCVERRMARRRHRRASSEEETVAQLRVDAERAQHAAVYAQRELENAEGVADGVHVGGGQLAEILLGHRGSRLG